MENKKSAYEEYLQTDKLLALQKLPGERVHHDELLFQVVHQSSELYLKLAWNEIKEACEYLIKGEYVSAMDLLSRADLSLSYVVTQLDMLKYITPHDFKKIRKILDGGSGFGSPGWNGLRRAMKFLGSTFHTLCEQVSASLLDVYTKESGNVELYKLAEVMVELDEKITLWRFTHYKLIVRMIGSSTVGKKGTPVKVLHDLIDKVCFPELLEIRNERF